MELVYIKVEVTFSQDEKSQQIQLEKVTQGLIQSSFDYLQVRDSTDSTALPTCSSVLSS